jgi:hypothetical protein
MKTPKEMALSLLRKWQEEERLVQGSITFQKTRCGVIGRIEQLDGEQVRIDASSTDELFGLQRGLILRFADVLGFNFEDSRFFSQQQHEMAKQIDEAFESFLSLDLGPCKCVLFACRLPSELST